MPNLFLYVLSVLKGWPHVVVKLGSLWKARGLERLTSDPGHLKLVILKPVGRMSIWGKFELPGVVFGCFLGRPFCASKQGLQAPGSELLGHLGIPRTEMWPKTGHADDWVYCDWV